MEMLLQIPEKVRKYYKNDKEPLYEFLEEREADFIAFARKELKAYKKFYDFTSPWIATMCFMTQSKDNFTKKDIAISLIKSVEYMDYKGYAKMEKAPLALLVVGVTVAGYIMQTKNLIEEAGGFRKPPKN